MPDTLKQFYNASINITGLTGNQTATLFTNNSTTRAVIKDVDVANTFPVTPNLTVGGTAVASLGVNLTGSEIVDVSQAVAMSFASPLALTSATAIYFTNQSGTNLFRASTAYNINGNTVSTAIADQTLPASQSSYTTFVYTAPDGDVFQVATNGDANNFLYKYAGSASGTQTTVNTGNTNTYSPIAFDGVSTFYWLTSTTNVRVFNANTETTTNITIDAVASVGSTAARLVFSNGYLFYTFITNDYPILIELSTGRWVYFVSTNANLKIDLNSSVPGFWFDTTTRVATIFYYKNTTTAGYQRHVSPSLAAFTASSATITTAWTQTALAASQFVNTSASASYSNVSLSSADGGVILAAFGNYPHTLSGISGLSGGWTISVAPLATVDGSIFRPRAISSTSPTVNTTNFPSTISLRLTGVEVTS